MKIYREEAKTLPVAGEYDVLVIGSGPAGMGAAIMAARGGAKVLVLEQSGMAGGVSTAGLMSHWTGTSGSNLYREILIRSAEKNAGDFKNRPVIEIDPEKLKLLYLEMLEEAGASIRFYSFVSAPIMEGDRIAGVITESKSGREAFLAKIVIDASGDGDVAAKAGVPYFMGRESDGKMQPATIMFKVAGVDYDRAVFLPSFESTYETSRGELQALAREHLPAPAGHVLLYKSTLPGVVTCNMTNCTGIDGTDVESLTRAEIECRKQIYAIEAFLREFVPGYENCYVISAAPMVGIRETRHFKGLYTITEEDILEARVFDDWVVRGAHFNFDVHNIEGAGLDKTGQQKYFPQAKGYTIPYRCLIPEGVKGLLLAGRNISGTHMAHSNYRVMPICLAMGEGAGAAAAIAVAKGIDPHEVDVKEIQEKLI
ncbi:MAG: FAD-dependent oxidoreductase [Clostridia bacterium]|nr:FAD-dependent oxidoreductase [Clostridia bacterium]